MKISVNIVRDGLCLRGYINIPDPRKQNPTVILFHGLTGNLSEDTFLLNQTALALEESGFCVVRFDFAHSGESDGSFEFMTPETELKDAREILTYVRGLPFVNPKQIAILGFSMGGYIASILAGEEKDRIKALVLWSPAGNLEQIFEDYFRMNRKDLDTPFVDIGGICLSKEALDSARQIKVYELAKEYLGPVLIVHSLNDTVVPYEYGQRFKEGYSSQASLYTLTNSGHTFADYSVRKNIIQQSIQFLKRTFFRQ